MHKRESLHVVVVTRYPWSVLSGGCELQASKYVTHAARNGIQVRFADYYDRTTQIDILHFVGISYSTFSVIEAARVQGITSIISPVYYTTSLRAAILSAALRMPYLGNVLAPALYKRALRGSELILPNSQAELRQLAQIFGVLPQHCSVIPNGVDPPDERVSPELFASKYGIKSDYVLCVAMIDERKNTLRLIRGFLECGLSDVRLVIVGASRTSNRRYYEQVVNLCNRNRDRIQMVGFSADREVLSSAYKGARVHVLPSHFETPGLSTLEAATYGCNLVVGDCAPVREYFGDVPFYCRSDSIGSIASAISASLKQDRRQAGLLVAEKYHWPSIGKRLSSLYQSFGSYARASESCE